MDPCMIPLFMFQIYNIIKLWYVLLFCWNNLLVILNYIIPRKP